MAWQSNRFQPRGGAMAAGTPPLLVVLALWAVVALILLVWVAAWLAALVTPGEVAPFGARWALWLVTGDTAQAWPGTPTLLVVAFFAIMAAGLGWAGRKGFALLRARLGDEGDPVAALNMGNEGAAELARPAAARKALRLRRSTLDAQPKALADRDVGLVLGDVKMPNARNEPRLFASWEDTVLAYMAPRAGKTTALAIPYVLDAPGPALATSNKGDVWSATAALREERTGERVWLFDPQHITHQKQTFWWNPLRHVRTVEDAYRLASHFVLTIDDEDSKKDMWGPAAKALLSQLMLAAALDGEPMDRVGEWLHDAKQPRPIQILFDHGFTAYAEAVRETQNIVSETRDGIFTTARTAARCLDDPEIMEWVTPPTVPGIDEFDPREFVRSRQTLHLLSKSRAASAPLIAAMTDAVFITAEEASEGMGGRLDPPLVAVLDEAANICKIADLPDMYSHLGSRGIVPVTILQSYRQGVRVWTENGMEAMWSAATVKLFGAGLDDQKIVESLSKLIGQHDVSTTSFSYGDGKGNHSVQLRRQEVMEGADIRRIGRGEALLFATAAQAVLLRMCPWYTGREAAAIGAAIADAESSVTEGAQRRYAAAEAEDG